jgi:hypothetical protein
VDIAISLANLAGINQLAQLALWLEQLKEITWWILGGYRSINKANSVDFEN